MSKINLHAGLLSYIRNRRHEGTPCEKVVSSSAVVNDFANFYEKNFEELEALSAYLLHEWEQENTFNKEELVAYQQGLSSIPSFLLKCSKEFY